MDGEAFDEDGFDAWLAGDPRRRSVFDAMSRRIIGSDMDVALNAYQRRGRSRRTWVASGAGVLLVLAGGYKAMPLAELFLVPPLKYAAAEGAVREIKLADGTRLSLAARAEVNVRYTSHDRVVELAHGTIFATVAHDERRPFRVDTGNARIVDVGTSFEVLSKPGNVRVTVASGVVRLGKRDWFSTPIDLTAKQAAVLDDTGLNRVADVTPDAVARWRGEWAEYKGVPLRQVIADLQPLLPIPIEITDERLGDKPVSGRIRLTDPVGQLQNLSITHEFRVRRTAAALILSNR